MVGSAGCCRKVVELPFKMVADNRNVVFMLRTGSRKPELQAIALKVIDFIGGTYIIPYSRLGCMGT